MQHLFNEQVEAAAAPRSLKMAVKRHKFTRSTENIKSHVVLSHAALLLLHVNHSG